MSEAEIIDRCRALTNRGTKATLPEVRPLVEAFYRLPSNGAGGALHVVLDDGNHERRHILGCIAASSGGELVRLNRRFHCQT